MSHTTVGRDHRHEGGGNEERDNFMGTRMFPGYLPSSKSAREGVVAPSNSAGRDGDALGGRSRGSVSSCLAWASLYCAWGDVVRARLGKPQ